MPGADIYVWSCLIKKQTGSRQGLNLMDTLGVSTVEQFEQLTIGMMFLDPTGSRYRRAPRRWQLDSPISDWLAGVYALNHGEGCTCHSRCDPVA